jgi:hypothetical protein
MRALLSSFLGGKLCVSSASLSQFVLGMQTATYFYLLQEEVFAVGVKI